DRGELYTAVRCQSVASSTSSWMRATASTRLCKRATARVAPTQPRMLVCCIVYLFIHERILTTTLEFMQEGDRKGRPYPTTNVSLLHCLPLHAREDSDHGV